MEHSEASENTHTTRRTLSMPALILAAVSVACAAALVAVSERADAAFPGKKGTMAYTDTSNGAIYSLLEPGGGASTEVAGAHQPSFSPDGNRFAHTVFGGASAEGSRLHTGGEFLTVNGVTQNYYARLSQQ